MIHTATLSCDIQAIDTDTDQLESKFIEIACSTSKAIDEQGIDVTEFKRRLRSLPVKNKVQHREFLEDLWPQIGDATVEYIWFKLEMYWNFLNYTLLEHLVKTFGDKVLKQRLIEYKKQLHEFRCKTSLCDFAQHFKEVAECSTGMKLLEVKFSKDWEQCTLEDLENWKEGITQKLLLPSFVMILKKINSGSVTVTWAIPAMFASSIATNLEAMDVKAFYEETCIISLSVTDGKLSPDNFSQHLHYLCVYTQLI